MVTPGVMTARGQTFIRRLKLKGAGSMESVASKRQSVGNDPFGIVAAIIRQVWKKLNDLENRHKWWTRLNHRLLIFISIGCGIGESRDQRERKGSTSALDRRRRAGRS